MSVDILALSTAETPPQCESPVANDPDNVSTRIIRLSMQKLCNKKHSAYLRNATLIKSIHRQALQQALEAAWLDESDCSFDEGTGSSFDTSVILDEPTEKEVRAQSMWDLVDEWENHGARKRSDDSMDCDEVCGNTLSRVGLVS